VKTGGLKNKNNNISNNKNPTSRASCTKQRKWSVTYLI